MDILGQEAFKFGTFDSFLAGLGTIINLINVEVGINVEGVQNLPNH